MKKGFKSLTICSLLSFLLVSCNNSTSSSSLISSSKEPNKYTVTWKNYDGSILEVDEGVLENSFPSYDGVTPAKVSSNQYDYMFTGWSPDAGTLVTSNLVFVATFEEINRSYTITWKDEDGTILKVDENVPYGSVPKYKGETPKKSQTESEVYTFASWSPEVKEVEGDATYVATYTSSPRKYNITWKNDDGSVLHNEEVAYGSVPSYTLDTPTKDSTTQYQYTFDSWYPLPSEVKGDAIYTATYTSEVRKYTVTWKNYDGTILETDEDVTYGETPIYNGETPTRKVGQGFTYTFSGWSPEINEVESDQTYIANYSGVPTFCFDTWDYELESGYTKDDLNGAPWIDPQVNGELRKIKKPSLKDDFYTSINYEAIRNGGAEHNPFFDSYAPVDEAMNALYDGSAASVTTNGDFLYYAIDKMYDGDIDAVKSYLNDLDLNQYLTSKESFLYTSSLLRLIPNKDTYEVELNDGYNSTNTHIGALWLFAMSDEDYETLTINILESLDDVFKIGLEDEEYDEVYNIETNLSYKAYYDIATGKNSLKRYLISELPWTQMKEALLDIGLPSDKEIVIQEYYINALNSLYNGYAPMYPDYVLNMIKTRYMFDSRFMIGVDNYKVLNDLLTQAGIFFKENNLGYVYSGTDLARRMARCMFPMIDEQVYLEQCGSEETKAKVGELIEDILSAYQEMAKDTWLGDLTKTKMINKLKKMGYANCYSDGYKCFPRINVTNLENASIQYFLKAYGQAKINAALNFTLETGDYFEYRPSYTVNAFYSPGSNDFIILNALASGLIGETIEERYGMLGMVIGHEITHAFDETGSQFDENGNYNNWWTSADRKVFNAKVDKMKTFFSNIALKKDYYVDGDDISAEATADMGGLKVAIELGKKVPNFDFEKFFMSYARLWSRPAMDINVIEESAESDSHPFPYLRGNATLAQFDEFINTFDIKPGDGMYIPEDQRVKIW